MNIDITEKKLNQNPFLLKMIGMGASYFVKTPWWLKKLYPGRLWNIQTTEKIIYLTFDDGPHRVATPFVLDELKKYNAKATFFCIGKNVLEQPELFKRITNEGHRTGNHTHKHLNGWETSNKIYLADISEAAKHIESKLFRPPYGRLKPSQARKINEALNQSDPKIVMWDVLSGDFDESITKEKCLQNVLENTKGGSIIVFHDSIKAFAKLEFVLPQVLKFFQQKGYIFNKIEG